MLLSSGSICSRPSSDFIFQIPSCPSALGLLGQNTRQDYGLQQKPLSLSSGCWNIQIKALQISCLVKFSWLHKQPSPCCIITSGLGCHMNFVERYRVHSTSQQSAIWNFFHSRNKHTGFLVQARYLDNVSQIRGWQSGWVCPSEKLIY